MVTCIHVTTRTSPYYHFCREVVVVVVLLLLLLLLVVTIGLASHRHERKGEGATCQRRLYGPDGNLSGNLKGVEGLE